MTPKSKKSTSHENEDWRTWRGLTVWKSPEVHFIQRRRHMVARNEHYRNDERRRRLEALGVGYAEGIPQCSSSSAEPRGSLA
jgi:hypothetical protein